MTEIRGLLFDKDGTLFDFQRSWGGWAAALMLELAGGDVAKADDLADRAGLDRQAAVFLPHSPIIAGTIDESVTVLLPGLPGMEAPALRALIIERSLTLEPVQAAPLAGLLARLGGAGLALGVATNDAEEAARAQLDGLGVLDAFAIVIGADSGHGAKPAPGQCLAFAEHVALAPQQIAMIGDSTHDLYAGRSAGMTTIAVLTGLAREAELAPFADVVLPDIGHLPRWLGLG